jgi:hypothetical protein
MGGGGQRTDGEQVQDDFRTRGVEDVRRTGRGWAEVGGGPTQKHGGQWKTVEKYDGVETSSGLARTGRGISKERGGGEGR